MSASRNTRRIVAAVAASVALVGAAALPAVADGHHRDGNSRRSSIVIGKVQYDSPGRDDRSNRSLNAEWVEVKNTGRKAVNLRGFTLTDKQGNRYRFEGLRLDGRSSVKVHTGKGRDSSHDVYQDRRNYVWDSRDTATLRSDRGHVIDTRSWGKRGR
ncbi:lamin tail domain-containing protein [Streptomyces sp. NPDC060031]|uniref:lamin tail domain-containing protein n=1 Tax=Streptomyces sp. NPDC060031 TaxID=3347043 RepID=UPI00368F2647